MFAGLSEYRQTRVINSLKTGISGGLEIFLELGLQVGGTMDAAGTPFELASLEYHERRHATYIVYSRQLFVSIL